MHKMIKVPVVPEYPDKTCTTEACMDQYMRAFNYDKCMAESKAGKPGSPNVTIPIPKAGGLEISPPPAESHKGLLQWCKETHLQALKACELENQCEEH